jgi:tRNA(His) 5'-end guanylyltransferase
MMTAYFNKLWEQNTYNHARAYKFTNHPLQSPAIFDARAFQCPKEDVANVFLWRVKDWERNSLNMFCGQFFSHKELQGQSRADRHEMLHKIGHNWATECTDQQKNGSWWSCDKEDRFDLTNYQDINNYIFGDIIDDEKDLHDEHRRH